MRRELRFIKLLLKLRVSQLMVFRLSFFGAFFIDGSMFILQLLSFGAIYSQVDHIGDWTGGKMILFIGTFSLINALNMLIYFFGILSIPYKVKDGSLDHYITKPMNPLLRLSFESIDLGSLPLVFFSIGIIIYGTLQLEIALSLLRVAGYVFMVLLMTLLFYDMEVILRTLSFFVISTSSLSKIEDQCLELCVKLPGNLFKGGFKIIFYLILPYGLMATIPAQVLSNSISIRGIVYSIVVVIGFTSFTLWFWKFGLRHYKSASS